jgi:uncharacterized protein YgiM (DUF1202 family)
VLESQPAPAAPIIYPAPEPAAPSAIDKPIAEKAKPPAKKYVTTPQRVNVRATASTKGKVIGVTAAKGRYEALDQKGDWVKIRFGTKDGWVSKRLTK